MSRQTIGIYFNFMLPDVAFLINYVSERGDTMTEMSKECDEKMLLNIKSLMLPLDSITEFGDECYAHLSEDGNQKETLIEHTERCQKYWFNIAEAKHIETVFIKFEQLYLSDITNEARHIFELMSVNVVTLHDAGKVNPLF